MKLQNLKMEQFDFGTAPEKVIHPQYEDYGNETIAIVSRLSFLISVTEWGDLS